MCSLTNVEQNFHNAGFKSSLLSKHFLVRITKRHTKKGVKYV